MTTQRWYLKGRKVSVVGAHSGQQNCYCIRILWSPKLGLDYFESFSGLVHTESAEDASKKASKLAAYIEEKGYIHPDMLSKDGKEEWKKDFYPSKRYLRTTAD